MHLKARILSAGRDLGFSRVGIAAAKERPEESLLREWLRRGYAGGMGWMHKRRRERSDPTLLAPWVRTLILATLPYGSSSTARPGRFGRISRYARGRDYHRVLRERLTALGKVLQEAVPGARVRPVVDTGAVLEKPWAAASGLGWQGKHTNLIDPVSGSWLFIGEIFTDVEIVPDEAPVTDHCGSCTRCLEACPTDAFPEPYVLDSRRCVSYLTIEHRGVIPEELRPAMGDWIFGCDICQEVCPWNQLSPSGDSAFEEGLDVPELGELLRLTPSEFRRRFAGNPIRRAGWSGFLRNVAVALGNSGDPGAIKPLTEALEIEDPVVHEHVVWALGRLQNEGRP